MPIDALLEQSRNEYQMHLKQAAIAERLKNPNLVTELAMRINGESWDERLLLVRIDIVSGDPDKPELINVESHAVEAMPRDTPSELVIDGVIVKVARFRWDRCVVKLNPGPTSWSPIWKWFDSWFDIEGRHQPDDDGFESVIHAFSPPEPTADGSIVLTIDFGSAPITCVTELIKSCRSADVTPMIAA